MTAALARLCPRVVLALEGGYNVSISAECAAECVAVCNPLSASCITLLLTCCPSSNSPPAGCSNSSSQCNCQIQRLRLCYLQLDCDFARNNNARAVVRHSICNFHANTIGLCTICRVRNSFLLILPAYQRSGVARCCWAANRGHWPGAARPARPRRRARCWQRRLPRTQPRAGRSRPWPSRAPGTRTAWRCRPSARSACAAAAPRLGREPGLMWLGWLALYC